MLSFDSVADAYGLIYSRPSDENFSFDFTHLARVQKFQFQFTPCLMVGGVSLEKSPKNVMIQDMINSESSMNTAKIKCERR